MPEQTPPQPDPEQELAIHRAGRAKQLLEDDLIKEAFTNIDEVLMFQLRNGPLDKLPMIRARMEAMGFFRQELQHVLMTGTMTDKTLADQAEMQAVLAAEERELG